METNFILNATGIKDDCAAFLKPCPRKNYWLDSWVSTVATMVLYDLTLRIVNLESRSRKRQVDHLYHAEKMVSLFHHVHRYFQVPVIEVA